MGRTNLAKARARALRVELRESFEKRKKISSYLKKLDEDYDSGKISYERYTSIISIF
jgi:hypothetical protein